MAECPLCDFTGSSTSVMQHITARQDEVHEGRHGMDFEAVVRASVGSGSDEEIASSPEAIASDPPGGESGSEDSVGRDLLVATALFASTVLVVGTSTSESVEELW